jgi:predicted HD phosphohydrolase
MTAETEPRIDQFRRMDESTQEQWAVIGRETFANQSRVADRVIMLLESLREITDGFSTDQLTHCLQTATLAERAGADDEVVVAALCHDIGKAISVPNHPMIAAEILKPYVRPEVYDMIRVHQDFQGKHYYAHFGGDPNAREQHRANLDPERFTLAERFADEWDQVAFDPSYDTLPLEHFEPKIRAVFGQVAPVTPKTSVG